MDEKLAIRPFDCDVLIIGGGPTGVTLAALLARRGISVIVAEKEAAIFPLPRAAHIDHEGMRILQEAGAAEAVMATSRRADAYEFRNSKGRVLMRMDGATRTGPGGWPIANMIHQPSVEAALRAALAERAPDALRCDWEMLFFAEDTGGLTATFATQQGERHIRARYLVGADGARSPVCKACGITFEDLGFEEPWLVVDVLVDDPARLPTANLQICDSKRPTTCVLTGEGRHRWEFMIKPGESPEAISAPASVERLLPLGTSRLRCGSSAPPSTTSARASPRRGARAGCCLPVMPRTRPRPSRVRECARACAMRRTLHGSWRR